MGENDRCGLGPFHVTFVRHGEHRLGVGSGNWSSFLYLGPFRFNDGRHCRHDLAGAVATGTTSVRVILPSR